MIRYLLVIMLFIIGCYSESTSPQPEFITASTKPITDLGTGMYLQQFQGGLYAGGTNIPIAMYDSLGINYTKNIKLLNTSGVESSTGKIVLLSIGPSNAAMEWCANISTTTTIPCTSWSFIGKASSDAAVRKQTLRIFNGAMYGQDNTTWDDINDSNYNIVNSRLVSAGLSPNQVQIIWLKIVNKQPVSSLPEQTADAYNLLQSTGNVIRTLKIKYPNLQQIFISPRIYGGYAKVALNPEPYAYETAFAVKWIIQSYITELQTGVSNPIVGPLPQNVFISWGPYMWANGTVARSDGLRWMSSDFQADGTHPNTSGQNKAASLLLTFFKTSNYTKCWFLKGQVC